MFRLLPDSLEVGSIDLLASESDSPDNEFPAKQKPEISNLELSHGSTIDDILAFHAGAGTAQNAAPRISATNMLAGHASWTSSARASTTARQNGSFLDTHSRHGASFSNKGFSKQGSVNWTKQGSSFSKGSSASVIGQLGNLQMMARRMSATGNTLTMDTINSSSSAATHEELNAITSAAVVEELQKKSMENDNDFDLPPAPQ
eukprot:jgi/Hompol1/3155/HPOL_006374-RA